MKLVLTLMPLVLGVCIASPLDKNDILRNIFSKSESGQLTYGRVSYDGGNNSGKVDGSSCHEVHKNDAWGYYIPEDLKEKTKDVNWKYNKYLGNITQEYWNLLRDTNKSVSPVYGLPEPEDRTFEVIPIPNNGGQYEKMINAKTENLNSLQNKSLYINFNSQSALLRMESTEQIHLSGQFMRYHPDGESPRMADPQCTITVKPGNRFQVQMNLEKDEQGQYHVTMNQCTFDISKDDDSNMICLLKNGNDNNDQKESSPAVDVLNSMAQLVCQEGYFAQIKDKVEQEIRLWNPSKRAETYVNTEIYKLTRKYAAEKLQNNIEVNQKCSFKKYGYTAHFNNVKIYGLDSKPTEFHPAVPSTYASGNDHHVDTMLMSYQQLAARYRITVEFGDCNNSTVEVEAEIIAPAKIALHFSSASNKSGNDESFSLRYHPDVTIGGTYGIKIPVEHEDGEILAEFHRIYRPVAVNALITYVQRSLFDFLYPNALADSGTASPLFINYQKQLIRRKL